jgi:acetolactate synthase-1/2/3 large subunit
VAFFAYPERPSILVPEGCDTAILAAREEDGGAALEAMADRLVAPVAQMQALALPNPFCGALNAAAVGASIARHMPEGTIISDDAVTAGQPIANLTKGARPHDWLGLTGGAIGQGIPLAVGAAVAAPDRKILCLTGDGAGMYTIQGLWTLAREGLDVTVVVFANHLYRILGIELGRTGAGNPGPAASRLLSLGDPDLDWLCLAKGMGLPAERCPTAEAFDAAFARAMAEPGPRLIEAIVP